MQSLQAYPDFQIMDYFVIRTLQSVLQSDASPTVRPMTYYVESPQAISGLFSNIAYAKCKWKFWLFYALKRWHYQVALITWIQMRNVAASGS